MSKINTETAIGAVGAVTPSGNAAITSPATATTRKRGPRIGSGSKKSAIILQKEAELRDARIMDKLLKAADKLSPWGKGLLLEELNKGAIQPALPGI